MFRSVLVPLDGSPLAERAIDPALAIVKASAGRLHLATVRRNIPNPKDGPDDVERLYLDRIAGIVSSRLDEPVARALLVDKVAGRPMGHPPRRAVADVLEDYVREQNIDLTVMTTHGRGGLTRLYMGSVADAFIRYSPSPVLVFRPTGKRIGIKHLLVLLDGSAEARVIIQPAIDLARGLGAKCTLLRVVTNPTDTYEAARSLTEPCRAFASAGVEAEADVRISERAAAAILDYAVTNGVDALALTTRTKNALQRMFLGSVADTLVRKAGKPVLICNPFGLVSESLAQAAAQAVHGS